MCVGVEGKSAEGVAGGWREASWRESGGSGSGWWRREGVSWGALVERGAMGGGEVRRAVVG